jgi:hypothetical protein
MKTKKLSKKLALNKKTVANLENNEMGVVYGGCVAGTTSCPTSPYKCESIVMCIVTIDHGCTPTVELCPTFRTC